MLIPPQVSRVFVGGIPADVDVDRSIQSTSYTGQMEELSINGHDIGLWNFLDDGTSNIRARGAFERFEHSYSNKWPKPIGLCCNIMT